MNVCDGTGMMNSFYTHNPLNSDLDPNLHEPTDLVPGISHYSSFACTCEIPASSGVPAPSKPWRLPELPQDGSTWARVIPLQGHHEFPDFAGPVPPSSSPTLSIPVGNKMLMLAPSESLLFASGQGRILLLQAAVATTAL